MKCQFIARYQMPSNTTVCIPLFGETVPAGFPSPAQDYVERSLDLNELCIQHPAATYFVRAQGDSMQGAGIFDGDILVVDRSLKARHEDIVIACLDNEFTVKQLQTRPRMRLAPMNRQFPVIEIQEESTLEIFGVVSTVIHQLRR
ncbi:translesion error-prone DNA polymerase V autoproteolytic subunit [Aliamphritea ceti]|uniref:translesion error-prone DNA polymerase V autoproteolytic subunit n=1 Tax=Aliamphritea ceti TaxID=1524258 RepID=UPI0021C35BA1|nr:translesion error-prone DNA polymerase V autoproteolytic subunit [Aliamphritea ceti]